jgi:hypothetical protein
VVRKRLDLNTYLITPTVAPRRRFIVHVDRIQPIMQDSPTEPAGPNKLEQNLSWCRGDKMSTKSMSRRGRENAERI